jgi:serine/threonine protein kinase
LADVKGGNILVNHHGVVKLADFGTAKHIDGSILTHAPSTGS